MSEQNRTNGDEGTPLPPFYKSIHPLYSKTHSNLKFIPNHKYAFAAEAESIVLAAEEFPSAERDYAIVFSTGANVMPVALTGSPGSGNQFVQADGNWKTGVYIPAYLRRYPFILAKAQPDATELTLCFDPESSTIVESEEGNLFMGDDPTELTKAVLQICQWFENRIHKTQQFVKDIQELDILIDGHASIQFPEKEPTTFRGFQIVSEAKLKNLADEDIRSLSKSGALALIHAHLFSLKNIERLFINSAVDSPRKRKQTPEVAA